MRKHRILCGPLKGKLQRRLMDLTLALPAVSPGEKIHLKNHEMDKFWHRLMSKTHPFRLTTHRVKSTLKKKKTKKTFFSLQVIFYIVWNFVMKIPSHHASSHFRQKWRVCLLFSSFFHSEILTACQIELFPRFCTLSHDPVLYISDALDLPQQLWPISSGAEGLTDRGEDSTCSQLQFSSLILWKKKSLVKNFPP